MKKQSVVLFGVALGLAASQAQAALISVTGPNSTAGTAAAIISAPDNVLDDDVVNTAMEGFDEAQGVFTSVAHGIDGGGVIAAGTLVDSHMIFLNTQGGTRVEHRGVTWTFSGDILGIMSDSSGNLEAASSFELGAPGTNYTTTFPGSGPAAPFGARGMEGPDGYFLAAANQLTVNMLVTEPGDWIRVVTAARPVSEPGSLVLLGVGLLGLAMARRRRA